MPPRGFTNPAPKTESARSALSSFTCTLCNKSYSRHPEYEAHISSYDHQHRKRLQDLKQLSRDPNAAEKARRAERKADAEAGLRVLDTKPGITPSARASGGISTTEGGGFKKGGFKSSFTNVKGPVAPAAPTKKNVLGNEDDDGNDNADPEGRINVSRTKPANALNDPQNDGESDTDDENTIDGAYYSPHEPTGCFSGCAGSRSLRAEAAKG